MMCFENKKSDILAEDEIVAHLNAYEYLKSYETNKMLILFKYLHILKNEKSYP